MLVKPALKETLKRFDASQYGGAPLLGLKGLVVKTHGNAKAGEVCNSIIQCVTFKEQGISEKIKRKPGCQRTGRKIIRTGEGFMEFEKLQEIIAEVMNVETDDITLDTSFVEDWVQILWILPRLSWELRKRLTLRFRLRLPSRLLR